MRSVLPRLLCLPFLLLAAEHAALAADSPAAGPLRPLPENPRWLTNDSGRPIVLTGSHTWSIFQDLEHLGRQRQPRYGSYPDWLRLLERWHHNFSRGWIWEDGHYSPLPYRKTGPRWDLDQPDPRFFRRLISRVGKAEERGIYISVLLFQGWSVSDARTDDRPRRAPDPWPRHPFSVGRNVNGISGDADGDGRGLELHEAEGRILDYQKQYVSWLVQAMRPFDNVIWEIANEAHPASLAWQANMVEHVRGLENRLGVRHLVWMSCAGGGSEEFAALLAGPADIVSPCGLEDGSYLDNPPTAPAGKIVIADSDHIAPVRVNRYWAWKSFLRGQHPIYMDLTSDSLPWYQGANINKDPLVADQMRTTLGTIQTFAERLPLESMAPQDPGDRSPLTHGSGAPPFALFTTTEPTTANPAFDGTELIALEPLGGKVLEICDLVPGQRYLARWLRLHNATAVASPEPFTATPEDPEHREHARASCRDFLNPDSGAGALLHLRQLIPD